MSKKSRTERLERKVDRMVARESKKEERAKKKHMMRIKAIQSFSPIRDVVDGIIVTKDNRFVKILEFSPINFTLRSAEEQDTIVAGFARVLKVMPVKAQFKVISRKADVTRFIKSIEACIENEQNANCRKLEQEQIDLIRRVGWEQGVSRRFFIIFEFENPYRNRKPSFEDIKEWLNATASRIISMMGQCENELLSPLQDNDEFTLGVLYSILSRAQSQQKTFETRRIETIARYVSDDTLDLEKEAYMPVNDFICPSQIDTSRSSHYIVIDGMYYAFGYIPSASYPHTCFAGWLSLLINMGEGIDVDFFVKKESTSKIQNKIQFNLRRNKSKARHAEDSSADYDDTINAIDAAYYLRAGLGSGEDFCYMATLITVTAYSAEDLEDRLVAIRNFLAAHDLAMKECWFQHEEAFLMSLPICKWNDNIFNKAKRNILTTSLASAYPFVSFEVTDENGIFYGVNKSNGSMVFIDNFDSSKYNNANMALLGTSGAGKTYTLQCIALRMREKMQQVFIIAPEKGHEMERACRCVGGQYIKISAGSEQCINIMEIRKRDTTVSEILDGTVDGGESILTKKIQQLHTFFSLLVPDINYEEKQLLDEAIGMTYRKFGITDDNASLDDPNNPGHYKPMPVLGDLHEELKKGGNETKRLYNILSRYVTGSAKSFNRHTNVDLNNQYIVLDVSLLSKEMLPVGMFIVLDYVWDKIREDRTKRKAIFLDELWTLIGAKASIESAEFVLEIFKVIRGYGGAAIAATQDLNDFFALDNGRFGKGIINNARIKFIMKLESEEAKSVGEALHLSKAELREISRFERGEGLLAANTNHVMIQVKASQTENDLITTDRAELERLARQKMHEMHADDHTN